MMGVSPRASRSRVAYQGEPGAFSEAAARLLMGDAAELVPCRDFDGLFEEARCGRADYALAPLVNTLAGPVRRCYELLLASDLKIVQEVTMRIAQHLIGLPGTKLEEVRTVESHPVALRQCSRFFAQHPEIERRDAVDTAASVRDIVRAGDPARAAIGSERAAVLYGAKILRRHVEDEPDNFTRFALLARRAEQEAAAEKLSLAIASDGRTSTLDRLLAPFVAHGIHVAGLLHVESPTKATVADLIVAGREEQAKRALDGLMARSKNIRVLGWYAAVDATTLVGSTRK